MVDVASLYVSLTSCVYLFSIEGASVCEPHARMLGLIRSCDVCDVHLCIDCAGEADLEPPFTTCSGRKPWGSPCEKRVCASCLPGLTELDADGEAPEGRVLR